MPDLHRGWPPQFEVLADGSGQRRPGDVRLSGGARLLGRQPAQDCSQRLRKCRRI